MKAIIRDLTPNVLVKSISFENENPYGIFTEDLKVELLDVSDREAGLRQIRSQNGFIIELQQSENSYIVLFDKTKYPTS